MGCVKRSIFLMKSNQMFTTYVNIFSKLAKDHKVYIVAGILLLNAPPKKPGSIFLPKVKKTSSGFGARLSHQGLYNVSLTFDPQGQVCHIVHKV